MCGVCRCIGIVIEIVVGCEAYGGIGTEVVIVVGCGACGCNCIVVGTVVRCLWEVDVCWVCCWGNEGCAHCVRGSTKYLG